MADSRIVTKALAGVEDLLLGEGTATQTRNGTLTNITKINASDLPYNASLSIRDKLAKKPEVLNTVAEMQLLGTSLEAEIYVYLLGYYKAGDGGGGLFWLDSSDTSSVQDNNLIFYPDTLLNGRWKRIDTQNQISPDNGDADLTIEPYSERIQLFATPLTVLRTVTLPTTDLFKGQTFSIVRKDIEPFSLVIAGGLGGFQPTISGMITVVYDGTEWQKVTDVPLIDRSTTASEGGTDVYVADVGISSYLTNVTYPITFITTNETRIPTIEINGLGQKLIKNLDDTTLDFGTLPSEALLRYNGSDMILMNPDINNSKLCKAWVYFTGGIPPDDINSFNVSSVARNSEGSYTINFNTAMANAAYVVCGSASSVNDLRVIYPSDRSISSVSIHTKNYLDSIKDCTQIFIAIIGN